MAVLDILSSTTAGAGDFDFLVAQGTNANPDVLINNAVTENECTNAAGLEWIEPGDNLKLQRLWVNIPFGFGQGRFAAVMNIYFKDSLNNLVNIPELGGNSILTIPDVCHGMEFPGDGLVIRVPTGAGRMRWVISDFQLAVSLVNVPAILVGLTLDVQVHFMMTHTRDMQAVP